MSSGLRQPEVAPRDQSESPFAAILTALVARVPGARNAALVDAEGETVDYGGQSDDPYSVRVAAAHWGLVLRLVHEQSTMAEAVSLTIRAERASFLVHSLPDGYAIVLLFDSRAASLGGRRALVAYTGLLAKEAGWRLSRAPGWYPVEVLSDIAGRPDTVSLAGKRETLEVVGRCADRLGWHERAWRVRLRMGIEAMLVRESGGFWYADEPLDQLAERGAERWPRAAPSREEKQRR